jgi:hypothetical protein
MSTNYRRTVGQLAIPGVRAENSAVGPGRSPLIRLTTRSLATELRSRGVDHEGFAHGFATSAGSLWRDIEPKLMSTPAAGAPEPTHHFVVIFNHDGHRWLVSVNGSAANRRRDHG